jgi:hypothetical protein
MGERESRFKGTFQKISNVRGTHFGNVSNILSNVLVLVHPKEQITQLFRKNL